MAITETTFSDLSEEQRKIAYAVYNKMASKSIDFKSQILSESDNVLMIKADGSGAGYRTLQSLKQSVEGMVVNDYSETVDLLNSYSSRAYQKIIGDGRKSYTVTHNLNADAILAQLWSTKGFSLPFYSMEKIDNDTLQIDFDDAIGNDSVQVVIQSNKYSRSEITVATVDWDDIKNIALMSESEMLSLLNK